MIGPGRLHRRRDLVICRRLQLLVCVISASGNEVMDEWHCFNCLRAHVAF